MTNRNRIRLLNNLKSDNYTEIVIETTKEITAGLGPEGKRTIMPKNILKFIELNQILNDINLSVPHNNSKINIYCEDARAVSFIRYILSNTLNINLESYMTFIDIDLGWINYVQLVEKGIPEFNNNIIVLDGDVPQKHEYRSKSNKIHNAENILFLPLVIEQDIFSLLKNYGAFTKFQESFSKVPNFTYDICFNNWPLEEDDYKTDNFKRLFDR